MELKRNDLSGMIRNIKMLLFNFIFLYQPLEQGEYNMTKTFAFYTFQLAKK
jgi:hypothetical protein